MKRLSILTVVTAAVLLLGVAAPVYASQDQHAQQEQKQHENKQNRKNGKKQDRGQNQQHPQNQEHPQKPSPYVQRRQTQQEQRPSNQPRQRTPQRSVQNDRAQNNREGDRNTQNNRQQQYGSSAQRQYDNRPWNSNRRNAWQRRRTSNWQSEHRDWRQRGGYHGYRLPNGDYRGYFGPSHYFLISGLPFMMYGSYPRFQYNGYWITMLDPWPAEWGNDWYDRDDVYVVYGNDGYYLYNRSYPGFGIAVSISR